MSADTVYVFRPDYPNKKAMSGYYGFTRDKEGKNLPTDLTTYPWKPFKEIDISTDKPLIGVDQQEVREALNEKGFFVQNRI